MMPAEDSEIIQQVLSGNHEAFGDLVARYNQRLFRVARSICRDKSSTEDVLQTAYLNAFTHLGQFQFRASFATWITRIVVREALRHSRKANPPWLSDESAPTDFVSQEKTSADIVELSQVSKAMESAIDELDDSFRTVFVMREIQGLATAEVARILEINEELVNVRLFRAKEKLRLKLSPVIQPNQSDAFVFLGQDCARLHSRVMESILALKNNFAVFG